MKSSLTLRVIDAAFFPHIVEEIFKHADIEALRVLSRVSRSFRSAARRRLLPLEHFNLEVVHESNDLRRVSGESTRYAVIGKDVQLRADVRLFDSGVKALELYQTLGPELFNWGYDSDGEESIDHESGCSDWDYPTQPPPGWEDSFDGIPQEKRDALQRARVLDIDWSLKQLEASLTDRLMPHIHTVRFEPVDNSCPLPIEPYAFPRAQRTVFLDHLYSDNLDNLLWRPLLFAVADELDFDQSGKFALCSPDTIKMVVNQVQGFKYGASEKMFPPTPRPTAQLKRISYVFKHWDVDPQEDQSSSLDLFVKFTVWAAGHGIAVTVVGAEELDPLLIVQRREKTAKGREKIFARGEQNSISRKAIVQVLKQEITKCAADVEAHPSEGMPKGRLGQKMRKNVTFISREQYRDMIGEEDFSIETEMYYFDSYPLNHWLFSR